MCGRLDYFLNEFAVLRSSVPEKAQPTIGALATSHNACLLLTVLDLIESGLISRNFIEPSFDLAGIFQSYCAIALSISERESMSLPFYQMGHSSFWELRPQPGQNQLKDQQVNSVEQLQHVYLGAKFSDDLYPLLLMPVSRRKLREVLIDNHIAPEFRQAIRCHSQVNCESELYARALLEVPEPCHDLESVIGATPSIKRTRELGFRKAVVRVYEHRCGLCGIKNISPEGESIVDASRVKDWIVSHDDHPTNGMALCRVCKYCFELGLMAVDTNCKVMISPLTSRTPNLPGHLQALSGQKLFKPARSCYWPGRENLEWHRRNRFVAE